MLKKHKGKDVLKVKVEILIKKVVNLKELNGGSVFVYWRRGTSKSSGETSHIIVRNSEAIFEEKISFESKFFIDSKSQKPDEKKLSLQLKEEKKKSQGKVLGKIELDLTSYMNSKHSQSVNLSFTKGLKPEPQINCSFNTIPIKFNSKPLVKVNNKQDASKDPRIVRTFGGDDYFLDKTDDELSDTTVDTSMATDITSNDFSDDDLNDDLVESKKDLKNEIDKLYKEIEAIESESYERLTIIKAKENEIETLKKINKDLQNEIKANEVLIDDFQIEKENLINQQINDVSRYSSGDTSSEVEILRQEKMEKLTIITGLEKEITKLKKQIKQINQSNSEFSNISGSDLRVKYQSLQQENEAQERVIAQLEKDKQELLEKIQSGSLGTSSAAAIQSLSLNNKKRGTDSPEVVTTKSNNTSGSIEELRKQSAAYKQELDEKSMIERNIFLAEPQFKGNLPVSGINIFDGLLSLGVLKDFKIGTRVFSSINAAFETTFKKCQNDSVLLAYWLSTSCLLLAKLKNKTDLEPSTQPENNVGGQSTLSPISSFEYNLKTIIFKFYSKLVQNAYQKLSPGLVGSILQHDILAFNSGKVSRRKSTPDIPAYDAATNNSANSTPTSSASYSSRNGLSFNSQLTSNTTLDVLKEFFEILRQNYVHPSLIIQFYSQLFYYINSSLLKSLNSLDGLCSVVNGFQMKLELSKIQDWASVNHLDESINGLSQMIETANLLVMNKELLSDTEVLDQVCPSVSMYHLTHILVCLQPDLINSEPIPDSVFSSINRLIGMRNELLKIVVLIQSIFTYYATNYL
ncbi:hypothetical protein DICPUDRAFT_158016 [Dictyostelium purpureum]|uniref:C2 NT-type domain-containing protein n=1 Tax=Dictyostelium purpureum TaxID=5786 RepID=F1A0L5_DICPU|nr:uncharacterized protein DICPUDRAFT_158016 [Dictyostelium purpureum]EGC30263.1 hypothetical protein DICPUDRAFT_158016 [Dictyostelium purpureum]|eukprot:XP_003293215.1 hypothetical protein DICPUDRAFT_158016 [Dictyostelium purpureum]